MMTVLPAPALVRRFIGAHGRVMIATIPASTIGNGETYVVSILSVLIEMTIPACSGPPPIPPVDGGGGGMRPSFGLNPNAPSFTFNANAPTFVPFFNTPPPGEFHFRCVRIKRNFIGKFMFTANVNTPTGCPR